jgi:hypothetical protein
MRSELLEKITVGANYPGLSGIQRAELYASLGHYPSAKTVTILLITGAGKTQLVEYLKVRKRGRGRPF